MPYPICPQCGENQTYEDDHTFVCPLCFHEWTQQSIDDALEASILRDVNGNPLSDGDDVTIIKDLKLGNDTIKQGTKVKNIKILDSEFDGHDVTGKVDGFGSLYLKSSVVKK